MSGAGELRGLASDFRQAPNGLQREARAIVRKGGVQIKNRMQREMSQSSSFRVVAPSIDFDEIGGGGTIGVEVGPNAAAGSAAPLAGIAYFGGARGGGGTVPDPMQALEDEANETAKWIAKAAGDVL